jgi:hypothetical protein
VSHVLTLPGRYGSSLAAIAIVPAFALGLRSTWQSGVAQRAWVVHLVLGVVGLLALMALGIASVHQRPYWLALLPGAAGVLGSFARTPEARFHRAARWLLAGAVALTVAGQLIEGARGLRAYAAADHTHAPVRDGLRGWTPGTALLTLNFPEFGDDDKDALEPAWAHLPILRRLSFVDSRLPEVVPADPFWGQPALADGDRWWHTFAGFDAQRFDALRRGYAQDGRAVLLVAWDGLNSPEDWGALRRWAEGAGGIPGPEGPGQGSWLFPPPAR